MPSGNGRRPHALTLRRCRLYGFVDTAYLAGRTAEDVARLLVGGGADMIQVRAKNRPREEILAMVQAILPVTRAAGIPLIVNDHADIAEETGADGVHVGQEDLRRHGFGPIRQLLGPGKIIGISTHSLPQALDAENLGADYIGVGPVFPTGTKPEAIAVGLELVRRVAAQVGIPFVCIGGINLANVGQVKAAGAHWVAVVSAVLCAADVAAAAAGFKTAMRSEE